MGTIRTVSVLSELNVKAAMRRQIVTLAPENSLEQCIRYLIKYKISGLLITDEQATRTGVISKTDLMGAYYAGLPVETSAQDIMSSPPLFCQETQSLEQTLATMRQSSVYRLYVKDTTGQVTGVIAYPDIVGLLYSYCRECLQSRWQKGRHLEEKSTRSNKVKEIMFPVLGSQGVKDTLATIIEELSANSTGAVLIRDRRGKPAGVVSKTDLIIAYRRRTPVDWTAGQIMTTPIQRIDQEEYLESALQRLIFSQLHRIFVFKGDRDNLVGVLSLSDAARIRSGTCQACVSSRIRVEPSTR